MPIEPGFHPLWTTPMGVHRYAGADDFNALMPRVFGALRAAQQLARGHAPGAFFASDDDLLNRVRLPEWPGFVRFIVESLRDTVTQANRDAWQAGGTDLRVAIEGMWFQCANQGAFHDVHTHGNCSWSGVYVVQVDDCARRVRHPVYADANGCTRFYGPHFAALAGAHADLGNAYLQPPHIQVAPVPGQLLVFPSWLAHQALPYQGDADRIVVSFNASIHAARGGDRLHGYAAA